MTMKWIAVAAACLCGVQGVVANDAAPVPSGVALLGNRDYSYIYFEQGYPTRLTDRRVESMANRAARANPDVVVQTGFYSLKLDCDTMQLSGYDAVQGSDYVTALNEDVSVFTAADLKLRIVKDGIVYACTAGIVQDPEGQNVRLIQSGQFVQRFDHVGLVFTGENGEVLAKTGRLEITAWSEHVTFCLDLSGVEGITETGIQLTSPSGKVHRSATMGARAVLALQPHLDQEFQSLETSAYIGVDDSLQVDFDPIEQGLRIKIPIDPVRFPADTNRVDEFVIEVRNPSGSDRSIPLIFDEIKVQAITGTSMLLCEEGDGRPTGIPVQISKNWHRKPEHRVVHDGPWLRGYTMVPLKAGETKRLRLQVVTGYWGKVPAVSHSQLSVIGYGGNWKWDESALGSWGESMCYDPSQHLGASFITDVRPTFTAGKHRRKEHTWTENVGGGDFLVYFDNSNTYRWAKRLKTAYHWAGPNMTEVLYSGVTDDDAIRFNYRIRSVRTADYHRRFHSYKYEFLKDVASPKRLVFHQMAADYYNSVRFDRFYLGDQSGLRSTHIREPSLTGYAGAAIPFENAWLVIDDTLSTGRENIETKARRGLLSVASKLNGKPFPAYLHLYSPNGKNTVFDLSSDSVNRSYSAGDVVEGELEFILPPKTPEVYWGADCEFSSRLESFGTNAWRAVADEFDNNIRLSLTMHSGRLLKNYPVEIQVLESGNVLADFTIKRGGMGHVPILLRGVPLGCALKAERQLNGKWIPLESVDIGQNKTYQGVRNADGTMDCVFNIKRPSHDLDDSWRIRILN